MCNAIMLKEDIVTFAALAMCYRNMHETTEHSKNSKMLLFLINSTILQISFLSLFNWLLTQLPSWRKKASRMRLNESETPKK